jgi:hypothetical protein
VGTVRAGHECREVFGLEERGGWRRAPVVQAAHPVPDTGFPQLVIDDAVQVGVVLGEVPGRVA